MSSLLICSDDGEILYQSPIANADELLQAARTNNTDSQAENPGKQVVAVRRNGLLVITEQPDNETVERPKLSWREFQVLECMSNAFSPEQTAMKLGIKVRTVRKHLVNLRRKFHTDSRDQLMARAGYLKLCNPYQSDLRFQS